MKVNFIPPFVLKSKISTVNSTEQELAIGGVFTGQWEDVTQYSEAIVSVYATENSATDGLVVQWSSNGSVVHGSDVFTITAISGKTFSFPCQNKYMRIVYTNNGVAQANFDLQTVLKIRASKGSSHRLKDDLVEEDDAIVTKSLIAGKTTAGGGGIINVKVTPSGALAVDGKQNIKNASDVIINPSTEETAQAIAAKKIGDSFWLKNVLSAITRITVDASGQLRAVVAGTVAISSGTITTVSTVTQANISIGDSGKTSTIIAQSNANFQGGARRLIRKV